MTVSNLGHVYFIGSNADIFLRIQDNKNTKERLMVMLQLWLGHSEHGCEVQLIQKGWGDQIVHYTRKNSESF